MRRAAAALVLVAALTGCSEQTVTELRGHPVPAAALDQLRLGQTTPGEIEQRFGPPDERTPDGALTYRYARVSRATRRLAGMALPGRERVEEHAVTFRFERGALARICQTRS